MRMSDASLPTMRFLPHGSFRVRALLAMLRSHWFIRLRWMITFGAVAVLWLERLRYPRVERHWAIPAAIGSLAVANLAWTMLARGLSAGWGDGRVVPKKVIRRAATFVNAQMTVDLLILSIILRYSGGVENPMVIFYFFHMVISVLLLRPFNAFLQGCWALLLYSSMAIGECAGWLTPHYPLHTSTVDLLLYRDWFFVLASIVVLSLGISGVMFLTLDISRRLDDQETELKDTNQALLRSQIAIRDLQERRARFMQTAAHQLKSPLAGIETLAGLIRDRIVGADQVDDVLQRINGRCRQAIEQVSELLTLARVQGAAPERHRASAADVRHTIEAVAERYRDQAKAKNIKFQTATAGGEHVLVAVDPRDLDNCIGNLVDNAIKYTSAGGTVWLRAVCVENTMSITVKDTGMGIAEEKADDLFDPFRRGNLALASDIPGSGLGLAIVREVVGQAHGRIEVKTAVGQGSEFTLFLPLKQAKTAPQPTPRDARAAFPRPPER